MWAGAGQRCGQQQAGEGAGLSGRASRGAGGMQSGWVVVGGPWPGASTQSQAGSREGRSFIAHGTFTVLNFSFLFIFGLGHPRLASEVAPGSTLRNRL